MNWIVLLIIYEIQSIYSFFTSIIFRLTITKWSQLWSLYFTSGETKVAVMCSSSKELGLYFNVNTVFFFHSNILFYFLINVFIYLFIFWVCWVFVSARGLSPVVASGGPVFIAVRRPLTVAASPAAEHRLQTRRLSSCGSWAQPLDRKSVV